MPPIDPIPPANRRLGVYRQGTPPCGPAGVVWRPFLADIRLCGTYNPRIPSPRQEESRMSPRPSAALSHPTESVPATPARPGMRRYFRGGVLASRLAALLLATACTTAPPVQQPAPAPAAPTPPATTSLPPAPEGASGWTDKPGWTAKTFMVAAANPLATKAGYEILRAGGSAV